MRNALSQGWRYFQDAIGTTRGSQLSVHCGQETSLWPPGNKIFLSVNFFLLFKKKINHMFFYRKKKVKEQAVLQVKDFFLLVNRTEDFLT